MKQIKFNLLAIVGMMVAVGTVAFTAPKESSNASSWYLIEEVNGFLTLTTESAGTPPGACPLVDPSNNDLCAVGINESGLSGMTLQDLEDEEIPIEESRFKKHEP